MFCTSYYSTFSNDIILMRVKVNRVFSHWLPMYCGFPQGRLLRPLLFNVFINDLNFSVNSLLQGSILVDMFSTSFYSIFGNNIQ